MLKIALKSIYPVIIGLLLSVSISAGAADDKGEYDTVELKNGDKLTGTLLTETFNVTTPYTDITLEKEKFSEITFNTEHQDHDVIQLKAGGLLEGTVEEMNFSFKPVSGDPIQIEKKNCKRIILK
ncbi:MAG: hypothetical protein JXL81_03590 [Deltaproteobacteria bacterium]|nr:hypothetical protein [Deltaproteobacteria bacterium]